MKKVIDLTDCRIIDMEVETVFGWTTTTKEKYCMTHHQYVRMCKICGVLFHTDRPHSITCSNKCRQKLYRWRRKQERKRLLQEARSE